jgi:hypothetical protein
MPDLTDVTTDELVGELKNRCDVFVCFMRPLARKGYDWLICVKGDYGQVMALIETCKARLISDCIEDWKEKQNDG